MPNLFLVTCGTSLITNNLPDETRKKVIQYTNHLEAELTEEEIQILKDAIQTARHCLEADLRDDSPENRSKTGAERKSIESCRNRYGVNQDDLYFLLHTDTYLGAQCAEILRVYLEKKFGLSALVQRMEKINTRSERSFRDGVRLLAKWATETLPEYREKKFKVIFNLSGGFKSLQGVLQTMGNFFADEIVYIFESSSELIRIPRLPMSLGTTLIQDFKMHIGIIRRIAIEDTLSLNDIDPSEQSYLCEHEILFETIGESEDSARMVSLSQWGLLCWEDAKRTLYKEQMFEPPLSQVCFSETFERKASEHKDRWPELNTRVDDFCAYLGSPREKNIRRLDLKEIKGDHQGFKSTHECDAWAASPGYRIFMHKEGEIWIFDDLHAGIKH